MQMGKKNTQTFKRSSFEKRSMRHKGILKCGGIWDETRKESSMIHSSRPVVKICFVLVNFKKWGRTDPCTDGRTTCVNIVITTGRDCGRTRGSKESLILNRPPLISIEAFYFHMCVYKHENQNGLGLLHNLKAGEN